MAGGAERIVREKKPCPLSTKLQHFTLLHQLKAFSQTELFFIPFFFPSIQFLSLSAVKGTVIIVVTRGAILALSEARLETARNPLEYMLTALECLRSLAADALLWRPR